MVIMKWMNGGTNRDRNRALEEPGPALARRCLAQRQLRAGRLRRREGVAVRDAVVRVLVHRRRRPWHLRARRITVRGCFKRSGPHHPFTVERAQRRSYDTRSPLKKYTRGVVAYFLKSVRAQENKAN